MQANFKVMAEEQRFSEMPEIDPNRWNIYSFSFSGILSLCLPA
jgi:hypothetical protein